MNIPLSDILYKTGILSTSGSPRILINQLTSDSRKVKPGSLYVAVPGTQADGHDFIPNAIEAGATAIVCEKMPEQLDESVTYIQLKDTRQSVGIMAANFYQNPAEQLQVVAITGTNGKTTISSLLYQLFQKLGYSCGLLSTVEIRIHDRIVPATHTTPDPILLQKYLADMVQAGCAFCFMEASSHGIEQGRTQGIPFKGAIFTNLTHDHLDYHGDFNAYLKAKKRLFDELPKKSFALVNVDDKHGKVMIQNTKATTYTYSIQRPANFHCKIIENHMDGLILKYADVDLHTLLSGRFNASNLTAVIACAELLEINREEVLQAASQLKGAEGRFEKIRTPNGVTVVIDYAHTPDALEKILINLRELLTDDHRLITTVGCGGNRDKEKRPEMGRIAGKWSDQCFFTSDNPRNEEPEQILADVLNGVEISHRRKCLQITDRRQAIEAALQFAQPGDILLIAGKGHEKYQEIKGVRHPFDDRVIVNEYLQKQ